MLLKNLLSLFTFLAVIATTKLNVEARRLKLRPLSSTEVYKILKEDGHEDAVPEGRVVTQGIAAITGFNLGLTAGIGGALLYDLITANITTSSNSTNSTTSGIPFITQDICFQSRSLEVDEKPLKVENEEKNEAGRQATTTGTGSTPTTTVTGSTPTTTVTGSTPTTPTATGTGSTPTTPTTTNTGSTTPTTSGGTTATPTTPISSPPTTITGTSPTTSPTTTNPTGTTGTATPTTPATGTGTQTGTQTGTGEEQTCISIQKPKARKRRSTK